MEIFQDTTNQVLFYFLFLGAENSEQMNWIFPLILLIKSTHNKISCSLNANKLNNLCLIYMNSNSVRYAIKTIIGMSFWIFRQIFVFAFQLNIDEMFIVELLIGSTGKSRT
jgi:hypothetical protein